MTKKLVLDVVLALEFVQLEHQSQKNKNYIKKITEFEIHLKC